MDVLFVCLFSLPEAPVPKLVGVEWVHFPWALQADWSCDCSHSFSLSRVVALLMSIAVITITGVFSCAMPMLVYHSAGGSVQLVCQRSNNNNNLIYRFHRGFYFDGFP